MKNTLNKRFEDIGFTNDILLFSKSPVQTIVNYSKIGLYGAIGAYGLILAARGLFAYFNHKGTKKEIEKYLYSNMNTLQLWNKDAVVNILLELSNAIPESEFTRLESEHIVINDRRYKYLPEMTQELYSDLIKAKFQVTQVSIGKIRNAPVYDMNIGFNQAQGFGGFVNKKQEYEQEIFEKKILSATPAEIRSKMYELINNGGFVNGISHYAIILHYFLVTYNFTLPNFNKDILPR